MSEKKAPQRTCIVCKTTADKGQFLRIVRMPDGNYEFDFSMKKSGRGAYICNSAECIEKVLSKKLLNKAFKTNIDNATYVRLREQYECNKN